MDNKKIVIFGSGGHGKVVLDILLAGQNTVLGFLDDDLAKYGQDIHGYPVLGGWDWLSEHSDVSIALGIGNNAIRREVYEKVRTRGLQVARAIHPRAVVSPTVGLGDGVVIMPGAVINTDAVLEDGVVVNTGATVDHDCHLFRFCQIWPGAHLAGTVFVGEESYIGTGAAVIQNIRIGGRVTVGAGAVVLADIADGLKMVGVPAKRIEKA